MHGGRGGVTEKTGTAEASRGRAAVRQGRMGSVSEGESGFAAARNLLPGFPLGSPVLVSAFRPFSVCAPALFSQLTLLNPHFHSSIVLISLSQWPPQSCLCTNFLLSYPLPPMAVFL